mmetsp:Transcript_90835/g.265913  ORF Transcript_90835/g.265913 Transcript_90835/m.265913 type:complete len:516 (+) Transcript_90835:55-1602(+)
MSMDVAVASRIDDVVRNVLTWSSAERQELLRRLLSSDQFLEGVDLNLVAFRASVPEADVANTAAVRGAEPVAGSEHVSVPLGVMHDFVGCPWCRRPVRLDCPYILNAVEVNRRDPMLPESVTDAAASPVISSLESPQKSLRTTLQSGLPAGSGASSCICTLLYGTHQQYFLGACVLGWCLQQTDRQATRMLIHTEDLPDTWLAFLADRCGWHLHRVDYMKGSEQVARRLFHGNVWRNRFKDVFTKLQALALPYSKVLLLDLDLLVRAPIGELLAMRPPAAMVRGDPSPAHGERVPYQRFWSGYERRRWDDGTGPEALPRHQQASGVNAGVMLLPGKCEHFLASMAAELLDWEHPEHYPTYMPEQEYLGRWCGTFLGPRAWSHIDCRFNYELDKDLRVPFDFTAEHRRYKDDLAWGLDRLAVAHFSGLRIKPWDLLFREAGPEGRTDRVYVGPPATRDEEDHLLGWYEDPLTKTCLFEWLQQFREMSSGMDMAALLGSAEEAYREKDGSRLEQSNT